MARKRSRRTPAVQTITVKGKKVRARKRNGYWQTVGNTPFKCFGKTKTGARCNRPGRFLKVRRYDGKVVTALCGTHVVHQCTAKTGGRRCRNYIWIMDRFCAAHRGTKKPRKKPVKRKRRKAPRKKKKKRTTRRRVARKKPKRKAARKTKRRRYRSPLDWFTRLFSR